MVKKTVNRQVTHLYQDGGGDSEERACCFGKEEIWATFALQ